jgi:RNA methyltransferase, TrmH family
VVTKRFLLITFPFSLITVIAHCSLLLYNRLVSKRIDSSKNPTIKALAELKERKGRESQQRYLIEGSRETLRALQGGEHMQMLLICPGLVDEQRAESRELKAKAEGEKIEILELSKAAFEKLSLRQNPDGIIAVAAIQKKILADVTLKENTLVLVIDGLEKPGNIGALLRSADAVNVDAVFVSGAGTDLYNPNVIRSSMGSLFSRPVLAIETNELLSFLHSKHFKIVAATPHTKNLYWHEDFTKSTAIILGTEHEGLSKTWLEAATSQVTIPMSGLADSLNVATAGALLLYEALRQRQ